MIWARMLAYITGTVDQELLLRNEYLAAENRILRAQIQGRLLLSDAEKASDVYLFKGVAHCVERGSGVLLIFHCGSPVTTRICFRCAKARSAAASTVMPYRSRRLSTLPC